MQQSLPHTEPHTEPGRSFSASNFCESSFSDFLSQTLTCPVWRRLVTAFAQSPAGLALSERLAAECTQHTVYPPQNQWLRALAAVPLEQVRVCIVGQDPYHGPGQAEGLAFSVAAGTALPRSLRNILLECGYTKATLPPVGSLLPWAKQGVLLLNTVLTVRAGAANSHAKWGWEELTTAILQACAARAQPMVFMLWGLPAQALLARIAPAASDAHESAYTIGPHVVLRASHPSPLGARRGAWPFVGCQHFARANAFLSQHSIPAIDWMRIGLGTDKH